MEGKIRSLNGLAFFFSSRRRHTRCYRDWSSDVCSSDLLLNNYKAKPMPIALKRVYEKPASADGTRILVDRLWPRGRSEERRVGKECRSRRSRYQYKINNLLMFQEEY